MRDEHDARARFDDAVRAPFALSRREARWLALGDDLVGFAADDDAGWQRLEREAWLLDRWRDAGVPVSRVVRVDAARRVQVRERLHGLTGDAIHSESSRSPLYPGDLPDAARRLDDVPLSAFGARLATSYGELAARIRRAVSVEDAAAAGFGPTSWRTLDIDDAITRLRETPVSRRALAAAERARDWLTAVPPPDAVIHADLHFFNMCLAEDGTITGVFDLSDAGLDTAAAELMFVHSLGTRFAGLALEAYGPIDVDDVRRAHLRAALDHVIGHGPGTPRHTSIIAWVSAAFEQLL